MQIRPAQFDQVARALEPELNGLPPKVVAIDGRSGVGKTTVGRFLSWYFNSSLLELDLFLAPGGLVHREVEVERIISRRLAGNRPIFVEGLKVLSVLDAVRKPHNYLIYVRNPKYVYGLGFRSELEEYDARYQPSKRANYILECEHDG